MSALNDINMDMKNKLLTAQHLSLTEQVKLLSEFVMSIDIISQVLDELSTLPNAWLGGGVIFQNVWNAIHGYEINSYIKDIDILYWDDEDLTWQSEHNYISTLNETLINTDIPFDVKNIARIHLWYEERFGIPKTAYVSVQESISTWPIIGACLAMRIKDQQLEFIAPHGFQDMFSLRVRPNKVLVNQAIYESKATKWQEQWPMLQIEAW